MNSYKLQSLFLAIFTVVTATAQLNGTYTIGGATPDYASINSAVTSLYSSGVNGPVTFNIRPGSYHEAIWMTGVIPGSSDINTITFQSELLDSSTVEIWRDYPDPENYVWRMDDVSFVNFRALNIDNQGTLSNRVLWLIDCGNITIENCDLEGNFSGTSSQTISTLTISDPDSNIVVRNSFIWGGTDQIMAFGTDDPAGNILIENNLVGNIYADDIYGMKVIGNRVGEVFFQGCSGDYAIENNIFDGFGREAIFLLSSNATRARVVNNTLRMTYAGTNNSKAFNFISSDNLDIYHNTIEFNTTSTYEHHFCMYVDGSDNLRIYNNNFVKRGAGKVLRLFNTYNNESDYNNFYAESGEINYNVYSLGQWQMIMGLDSNSVSVDPNFISTDVDSLFPALPAVLYGGTPLPSVPEDIYGTPRHPFAPSIGAFEFLTAPVIDLGPDTTYCDGWTLDANYPVGSYLWSTGETTRTISGTTGGAYWVEVTNSEGSDRDTVVIAVQQTPVPNLQDSATICSGDSVLLDPQTTAASYQWSTGATSATVYAADSGWVSVVAANGFCTAGDAVYVDVIPPLTVDLGADTAICAGDSVVLDAMNTGYPFLWSDGSTAQTLVVTTSDTITVKVTDQCASYSDTVVVQVNSLPVITITGTDSVCLGAAATLNASGATNYVWSDGSNGAVLTFVPSGTQTVQVVGVDGNGCADSAFFQVEVSSLPVVQINGDSVICAGDTAHLMGGTGVAYTWSTGDTGTDVFVSPNTTQDYTLTVVNAAQCSDSATFTVVVNPLPAAPVITQNGGVISSTNAVSYQWFDGAGAINGAVNDSLVPSANGPYWVEITDVNGCSALSDSFNFQWIGWMEQVAFSGSLYPNPAVDEVRFTGNTAVDAIAVYDASGACVYLRRFTQGEQNFSLDVSQWANGVYVFYVQSNGAVSHTKLIIAH